MKIASPAQMREIDRRASEEYGIPSLILMENAGLRVVEVAESLLEGKRPGRVLVAAGKGNNGGDGMVAARHLINSGVRVDVFLLGDVEDLTPDAGVNYGILAKMGAAPRPLRSEADFRGFMLSLMESDMVVDAMYGTSFRGSLSGVDAEAVRLINLSGKPVLAVDIPSGVEADTGRVNGEAVRASWTVTLALPKPGLLTEPGQGYAGVLTVADISIPQALLNSPELKDNLLTEEMITRYFGPRPSESHKGTYGHVLVVGGSIGMTGAVVLASSAALVTGSGLVTAALPQSLLPAVESSVAEVMTTPLAETGQKAIALEALPALENLLGTVSVCAFGPGMSRYKEAHAVLRFVLERSGVPLVIDADGLNALSEDTGILKNRQVPIVLTPHPGEMARLLGTTVEAVQADRKTMASQAARDWGVTVVLKGSRTVVAQPDGETYLNVTGNPGMGTGGSGDVLTGVIAGLIAQGMRPNAAACVGVYLHGRAGDQARETCGERGLVAGDIIRSLPVVLKALEENSLGGVV